MAYFISGNCGGLRVGATDFTQIDDVITSATAEQDTYTPTYSTGVTATFDADKYADTYTDETTTFTATVADTVTTWSDGTSTLSKEDMADVGFSAITGVVDGSTITVTYAKQEVPRTELVGDPFVAKCGGQKFDDGVFESVKVNGKDVITTVGSTADSYFAANCSLLFDADVFELGDDDELILATV